MRLLHVLTFLTALFVVSCLSKYPESKKIKVYLLLSVDWEGDTLREANLKAMRKFNKDFPDYPMIHFLNAAYYSKKDFYSASEINQRIQRVLKTNDELGLHIHSWKNLAEASGVTYIPGPSFWGKEKSVPRGHEQGDDVPLTHYSESAIFKMLQYSIRTLKENGFSGIESFRAGGWVADNKVFRALKRAGLQIDSSAVPDRFIDNLYPGSHLSKIHKKIWAGVSVYDGPYYHPDLNDFVEFPNNLSLADYLDENQFLGQAKLIINRSRDRGKDWAYLHFGFHQESAVEFLAHKKGGGRELKQGYFLKRVRRGLHLLNEYCQKTACEIVPVTFKSFPEKYIKKADK